MEVRLFQKVRRSLSLGFRILLRRAVVSQDRRVQTSIKRRVSAIRLCSDPVVSDGLVSVQLKREEVR